MEEVRKVLREGMLSGRGVDGLSDSRIDLGTYVFAAGSTREVCEQNTFSSYMGICV